jgi:hypothetical protein
MHYRGPDRADLTNVLVLNRAFVAWQRTRPRDSARERDLSPQTRARFAALNAEQRERLARIPFLLMSFAEDDEARWQSLFAEQRTRDLLLQCVQVPDEVASRVTSAGLGFLWQLAQRNPYAARLVSGASPAWCEQLAASTLMDLLARALEDPTLLAPRMAGNTGFWDRLLTAGVSNRRQLRLAARVAALQAVLTRGPVRADRLLRAAACGMPAAGVRRTVRRGR